MNNQHIFRIVATSDLHVGTRLPAEAKLRELVASVGAANPDLVVILGDILNSHDDADLSLVFNALAQLPCPIGILFGNHDMWLTGTASGHADSSEALEHFCDLALKARLHPLDRAPLQVGNFFVCGTCGWYDYSFGDPYWSDEDYDTYTFDGKVWEDGTHVRWGQSNRLVSLRFAAKLEEQLSQTPASAEPIVVTHMAALKESLLWTGDPEWDFFNAYNGSKLLGGIITRPSVRLHLHGHVHDRQHKDAIPFEAVDPRYDLRSYNACYYPDRPFIVCDLTGTPPQWKVQAITS